MSIVDAARRGGLLGGQSGVGNGEDSVDFAAAEDLPAPPSGVGGAWGEV